MIHQPYNLCSQTPNTDIAVIDVNSCLEDIEASSEAVSTNVSMKNIIPKNSDTSEMTINTEKTISNKDTLDNNGNKSANGSLGASVNTEINYPIETDSPISTVINIENQGLHVDNAMDSNVYEPLKSTKNATENTIHTEKEWPPPLNQVSTNTDIINTENNGPINDNESIVSNEPSNDVMINTVNDTENIVHAENQPTMSQESASDMEINAENVSKYKPKEPNMDGDHDTIDWEKLMINSDDSLFDKMTKQMDGKGPNTSMVMSPSASLESEKEQAVADDKLPDLT